MTPARTRIAATTRATTSAWMLACAFALAVVGAPAGRAFAASAPAATGDEPPAEVSTAPVEKLTLADALARAFAQNPSAVVAAYEIDRAEGLLREARGAELPTFFGFGTYTRLDHDRYTSTGVKTGAANQWAGSLLLTVPLVVPTAWAGVHRATTARNLAEATASDVRRELATAVARAYLAIVLQRRQVEIAIRARETARAHFDFAHRRMVGGLGTSLDDVRAEQELRTDEAQVASSQAAQTSAQAALAAALSSDHPVDAADEVPLPAPPDVATATRDAQQARTDVKVKQAELVSANHADRDVWALYSPYLVGNAQAFAQDLGTGLQPTRGWQAQLLLTVPFYDGGIRTGVSRERAAVVAEARAELDGVLRQVAVDVRAAFDVVLRSDQAFASASRAAALARRASELADIAYRAGATTNLEVIDAERRARDAETQAALAEDAAREARLDLLLATGRFP